jgi:hypothetical protein
MILFHALLLNKTYGHLKNCQEASEHSYVTGCRVFPEGSSTRTTCLAGGAAVSRSIGGCLESMQQFLPAAGRTSLLFLRHCRWRPSCLCLIFITIFILETGVVPQNMGQVQQGSFVIWLVQTNKFACLWQEGHEKMICTLLDFWAEKKEVRDCLALLTTDISTSFKMKKQTMAAL